MLILILIDVQYLQNVVFSFEKGLNVQNHSLSDSHHPTWKFGKFSETIHRYRVFTPCGNNETNFRFPWQILAETIRKRW